MALLTQLLTPSTFLLATITAFLFLILYGVGLVIYNIFFHPLRNYPGPKIYAASPIPALWYWTHGRLIFRLKELHDQYGSVVRIAPNEVVFTGQEAQKDIYAYGANKGPLPKCRDFYFQHRGADSIFTTHSNAEHARIRKLFNPGFSERAMREQESSIMHYIDLFIIRLQERLHQGPQDLSKWFNLITFDVIGDLAFGEPFGSVDRGEYHPWVHTIMDSNILRTLISSSQQLPVLAPFLVLFIPRSFIAGMKQMLAYTHEMLARRIPQGTDRSDFISPLLLSRNGDSKGEDKSLKPGFTDLELEHNASSLVMAGSETVATLMTALTYHLCMNPHVLDKATAEVRSAFERPEDINLVSVQRLEYVLAVLDEGLRIFPPASAGLPRRAPKGGSRIAGNFVPEGARVHVSPWASYHSAERFYLPDSFIPERWLGTDPRFANDDRSIVTPFSIGPRNCIGINLAYAEMRTILAKMLWHFDLTLAPESYGWLQTARKYQQWWRDSLWVNLTPRKDVLQM